MKSQQYAFLNETSLGDMGTSGSKHFVQTQPSQTWVLQSHACQT